MSFARLRVEASALPLHIHGLHHAYVTCRAGIEAQIELEAIRTDRRIETSPAAKSLQGLAAWVSLKLDNLQKEIDAHFRDQLEIIEKIEQAISKIRNYSDVLYLLSGSVAKLEYIAGISDIDIIGMTTDDAHIKDCSIEQLVGPKPTVNHGIMQPIFRWFARRRARLTLSTISQRQDRFCELKEMLRTAVGVKKLDLVGSPFYGKEYFFTAGELFDKLGAFDEPSWAVSHRASLMFESELYSFPEAVRKHGEFIRSQVNHKYWVIADLRAFRFPMLGALLMTFLTKSGVLAKISWLKSPESKKAQGGEVPSRENELLKTIGGRIWSSAAHMILFHVLYWSTILLPQSRRDNLLDRFSPGAQEFDERAIMDTLYKSPIVKMTQVIPHIIAQLKAHMQGNWHEHHEVKIKSAEKATIEDIFTVVYRFLGPLDSADPGRMLSADGEGKSLIIMPMPYIYLSLLLVLRQARERKLPIPPTLDGDILSLNKELYLCMAKCEELTTVLINRVRKADEELTYLRFFGGEVFDKAVYGTNFS